MMPQKIRRIEQIDTRCCQFSLSSCWCRLRHLTDVQNNEAFRQQPSWCLKGQPTRGLLAMDHVILNHGQVMWTTPELAPPLLTTTPTGRRLSSRQIQRASLPYTAGLYWYWAQTYDMPDMIR
ncbi:hypothetical protein TNCV_4085681 [Trichonephila clavipes]|nr:hypothetical protein TNCV_4085681 [Trichonephila clavipes]